MTMILSKKYDIIYDIISFWQYQSSASLKKGVNMISYMISYCNYDIIYDIISFFQYHSHLPVSCAIFSWCCLRYHIHFIENLLWYQNYMILSMILTMIWLSDISIAWYHSHMISRISWYVRLYHVTCTAYMI